VFLSLFALLLKFLIYVLSLFSSPRAFEIMLFFLPCLVLFAPRSPFPRAGRALSSDFSGAFLLFCSSPSFPPPLVDRSRLWRRWNFLFLPLAGIDPRSALLPWRLVHPLQLPFSLWFVCLLLHCPLTQVIVESDSSLSGPEALAKIESHPGEDYPLPINLPLFLSSPKALP